MAVIAESNRIRMAVAMKELNACVTVESMILLIVGSQPPFGYIARPAI